MAQTVPMIIRNKPAPLDCQLFIHNSTTKIMRGITGLIAFIFLLIINTLSAQSEAHVSKNLDIIEGTSLADTIPLKRYEKNGIAVYPSPAKDDINIQFEMTQATIIRMSNILGNVLYETTVSSNKRFYSTTLNVSNLPKGLYFITIDDGVNAQTKRFVKE